MFSVFYLGGIAIKNFSEKIASDAEQLGVQKTIAKKLEAENASLSGDLKAVLAEINESQRMMRELANVDDKTEVGPSGTIFLDGVRSEGPRGPIPARKPAGQ